MLSALFSSFANFFETSYIVVKKTTGGFITFLFGAIVCVIAQVLLIPLFGLNGAGLASMLGFLTTFLFRVKDTQKFVVIQIKWRTFISNFCDHFGTNSLFILSARVKSCIYALPYYFVAC
jgi:O-antigen/teichoic acid export membrane protein